MTTAWERPVPAPRKLGRDIEPGDTLVLRRGVVATHRTVTHVIGQRTSPHGVDLVTVRLRHGGQLILRADLSYEITERS